ncbi:MAG: amidohydrolase family protein [Saprospiraceae bacterium]|nr:amidohydrolase family protein [Saprospiraceae bacterium]
MNRRRFNERIIGGALGIAGSVSATTLVGSSRQNHFNDQTPVIEWNTHIFSGDLEKYPFHPNATYQRDVSQEPDDPLAAYLDRCDQLGIDHAVIVHPEPYGDDHRLVIDCLEREPERLRGTSLFYPKDQDAPNKLKALAKANPGIVSTRFHAHKGKEMYLDSFSDTGVRNLWKAAVDSNFIVELHIGPDYAKQVAAVIKEFPGCRVLIDHLAEPHLGTGVEFADVLDLAKFPNVYMKLSGLNHFATDEPHYLSAKPFTKWVIEAFGPDQLVWGSGVPTIVDKHMDKYTADDISKVKGGNLQKLLNW